MLLHASFIPLYGGGWSEVMASKICFLPSRSLFCVYKFLVFVASPIYIISNSPFFSLLYRVFLLCACSQKYCRQSFLYKEKAIRGWLESTLKINWDKIPRLFWYKVLYVHTIFYGRNLKDFTWVYTCWNFVNGSSSKNWKLRCTRIENNW